MVENAVFDIHTDVWKFQGFPTSEIKISEDWHRPTFRTVSENEMSAWVSNKIQHRLFLKHISRYLKIVARKNEFKHCSIPIIFNQSSAVSMSWDSGGQDWLAELARIFSECAKAPLRTTDLRLDTIASLENGWLDEDSVAPSMDAIAVARKILQVVETCDLAYPDVSASGDGSVHLDWRGDNLKASLRIEFDGVFGYAIFKDGRYMPGKMRNDENESALPSELMEYLRGMRRYDQL